MVREKEKGAVTMVVVFSMVVVVGFGALVIDGGMMYFERTRMQGVVDAASTAGASVLESYGTNAAIAAALEVVQANGVSTSSVDIFVDTDRKTVSVMSGIGAETWLAGIIGVSEVSINTDSGAQSQSLSGVTGAVPLGVMWDNFIFGQQYILKFANDGNIGSWRGILDLGVSGGGSSEYRQHLEYGWNGLLRVGDSLETVGGNRSGPTRDAVRARLDRCNHFPRCTFDSFVDDCPRLVIVPVVNTPVNGRVGVLGFAGLFLEGVPGSGNESIIIGRFVEFISEGESSTSRSFGARVIRIIR